MRKQNQCPAIIYRKDNEKNLPIILNQNDILHPDAIGQLYKNNLILLSIKNKESITVKIQEIQYHPFKPKPIHIDFIRV
ncbi:50S ribosomal protein L25 [Candidatus Blochmannia sp. SNP]|uniref:50S ribosomal protein L25 n=1 Tax=Candidatus Blochmannia sp. SNP TaxID=3118169 RepID=UPI002F920846